MRIRGYLVAFPPHPPPWDVPLQCANCGAPPTHSVLARHRRLWLGRRLQPVPYCQSCQDQALRVREHEILAMLGCSCFGCMLGAWVLFVPDFPLYVLIALPALIAAFVGWLVLHLYPFRKPQLPRTAQGDAVWINDQRPELLCTNQPWAESFASFHGLPSPAPHSLSQGIGPGLAALGGAAAACLAALFAWDLAYPSIHIDNPHPLAIQVWLDGRKAAWVAPQDAESSIETIRVAKGDHRLGWSWADAQAPISEIDVHIDKRHNLYNPGQHACHWFEVTVYSASYGLKQGSQSFADYPELKQDGPLDLAEFYSFDRVNHWFEPNPDEVRTKKGSEVLVAVRRNVPCSELAAASCDKKVLSRLLNCQRAAEDTTDADRCILQARRACSGADQQ